jgi:Flp pilus assembly protein TadG
MFRYKSKEPERSTMRSPDITSHPRLHIATTRLMTAMTPHLRRLWPDQTGNVGMIFAASLLGLSTCVGCAVDYGRWLNARSQTQYALDAATLAAGRALQLTGDAAKAKAAADHYYAAMKSKITVNDTVQFVPKNNNTVVEAHGSAYIATPFLSIIGVDRLTVVADAATPTTVCIGPTCPTAGGGSSGNTGTSIEISMMLDTTGSMQGEKLAALKEAAKELVDIVIWDDQSQYTSRVAMVPFSDSVNVGSYFKAVTGVDATIAGGAYTYPDSCYTTTTTTSKSGKVKTTKTLLPSCANNPNYATYTCVVERIGVNEFTAVAPAGTGKAPKPGVTLTTASMAGTNNTMIPWNQSTSACHEGTKIQPLTDDKDDLKTAIDDMVAANATAGALGTAWAWYLLAPEWKHIFTGESEPLPYELLTELGDTGQPKLRKIAILMTDGAYNTHQLGTATASQIQGKAKTLCQAMKDKHMLVYTIGFQLGGDAGAINTLTNCASSHVIDTGASVRNFYNVETPQSLQAAFRDIALQISKLRLSH